MGFGAEKTESPRVEPLPPDPGHSGGLVEPAVESKGPCPLGSGPRSERLEEQRQSRATPPRRPPSLGLTVKSLGLSSFI